MVLNMGEILEEPLYKRLENMGITVKDLPQGPIEFLILHLLANNVTESKIIHRELCGKMVFMSKRYSCSTSVRKALKRLKDKGVIYRKKRYGVIHYYPTKKGKIIINELFSAGCP